MSSAVPTTRERVVDAAVRLTAQIGWSQVTMARLAQEVGVSRQTVYNEVGTKPGLAEAMILRELDRFLGVVNEAFDAHPDDLVGAIRASAQRVLEHATGNDLLHAVVSATHGADTELLPLLTTAVPSPLVCIVVMTGIAMYLGLDVPTVGDKGDLPDSLPVFLLPDIPLNLETLKIILPYSLALAVVGLLESMMTATIVDDLTDTDSDKNRECKGQGVANIFSGFLGGMAGCAMIGQSVINVKSGGRKRLSTLFAGCFLLVLVVFLGEWVSQIPMAALVAVMIMVSIGTFSWESITNMAKHPASSTVVMLASSAAATFNTADSVMAARVASRSLCARRSSRATAAIR